MPPAAPPPAPRGQDPVVGSRWTASVDGELRRLEVLRVETGHVLVELLDVSAGAFLGGNVRRWMDKGGFTGVHAMPLAE